LRGRALVPRSKSFRSSGVEARGEDDRSARLGDPFDSSRGASFDGTAVRGSARSGDAGVIIWGLGRPSRSAVPLARDCGTREGTRDGAAADGPLPAAAPAVENADPPPPSNGGVPEDPRGTAYARVGARNGCARATTPAGATGPFGRAVNCEKVVGAIACGDTAFRATSMLGPKERAGTTVQPDHGRWPKPFPNEITARLSNPSGHQLT
jgi:hypothetical protein